jgi:hypothetical protein
LENFSSDRLQVLGGLLLELTQADVLDPGLELLRLHRLHADLLADDVEVLGLGPALAHDADGDARAGLAPHALHRVGELHVLRGDAFDLHDAVAGLDARAIGGRALDGRHHGEDVVTERDLDAEAAEAAGGLDLHLAVHLGIEEGRMRIEAAERALDRVVDDVLGRDLVHVLALDDREHLGEQPQVLVGRRGVLALARDPAAERQGEHQQQRRRNRHLLHAFHSTYPFGLSHCAGSCGLPWCRTSK